MSINYEELSNIRKKLSEYKNTSLLLVTKNRDSSLIEDLINKGYSEFGENRVQEAIEKFTILKSYKINLHLIGPLQTNKVKLALSTFDTIQTLDRLKLIKEISKVIDSNAHIKTKDYFIQVNIGDEDQKSGVNEKNLKDLYNSALSYNLKVSGLMCIPPADQKPDIYFEKLSILRNKLNPNLKLSMGMSSDYEIALRYKSDIVRIGSRIFN